MLIIFEGVDKTGKSTLLKEVLKRTNYKHIVYDRGPVSQIVYSYLFDRDLDSSIYYVTSTLRNLKNLIVLCVADCDIIEQRLKDANEELPDQLKDIKTVQKMFEAESYILGFNVLRVDTTNASVNECVEMILNKIKEIEEND